MGQEHNLIAFRDVYAPTFVMGSPWIRDSPRYRYRGSWRCGSTCAENRSWNI